jgi:tRNA 2-selenouridine synthase
MPTVTVDQFLAQDIPLLDSRSPGEYRSGHIPGALSFPLFTDEERSLVGTCYKQKGQEAAVELGLELIGPKLRDFVRAAKGLAPDRRLRLHCWRGGMRSSSMAWLLETAGFQVTLLHGGYKAFRTWAIAQLARPQNIITLGGMTGTGKTELLYQLQSQGEQILDLEGYANHRGSSYGALGLPAQPSDEQFGNDLAMAWSKFDANRPIWIEAESRRIGLCRVPDPLFTAMIQAPIIQIERSRAERVQILLKEYGGQNPQALIAATERISRKLGGQNAQVAIAAIDQGDLATAIHLVLDYYDKSYRYDLERRQVEIYPVDLTGLDRPTSGDQLLVRARRLP